jgi:uncharacterized protein (DUF427 family)
VRHRVSTTPSTRHLSVRIRGELIAESDRVLELRETGHRTRWYLPIEDVREGVLEPSERTSHCPYKGDASYFSARVRGELHADVAWSYPEPIPEMAEIAGYVCFYPRKVVLAVT